MAKTPTSAPPAATATAPKKRTNPAQFLREVRAEARKVTWTSRKETWITTVMVFIMVVIAALFFFVVDGTLGFAIKWLVEIGK
ncbi:MAG: preprotein translocase subunit SecE [Asticcacaulis sp.]